MRGAKAGGSPPRRSPPANIYDVVEIWFGRVGTGKSPGSGTRGQSLEGKRTAQPKCDSVLFRVLKNTPVLFNVAGLVRLVRTVCVYRFPVSLLIWFL